MFALSAVIGVTTPGSLQPTGLDVVGTFSCPGGGGGVPVELRVVGPGGAPAQIFTATTSTGGPGEPPVDSFSIRLPHWKGAVCGGTITFEVRGECGGTWTAWESVRAPISCLDCPRIRVRATYGACHGTPVRQSVSLTATVMLAPGDSATFRWEFGDGTVAPAGSITNATGGWNTPFTLTTTHDYDPVTGPFRACLVPTGECPRTCIPVDPSCDATGCPRVTGTATVGPCAADLSRTVTYTLTLTPAAPQGSSVQVSWVYGGANTAGAQSEIQTVSTTAGPVSTITHTTDLRHHPGGYQTTATVVVIANGQLCPLAGGVVTIPVSPDACLPCPESVTVAVAVPQDPAWCAPVKGLAARLTASIVWTQPAPPLVPIPYRYDWVVTLPDGRIARQTTPGATVSTGSGWAGPGAVAGALDLSAAGSYAVGVSADFSPGSSGLPTDAEGAVSCDTVGSATITIPACPSTTPCPAITDLSVTPGCVDTTANTGATATATVTLDDPAGLAQSYQWDFGDPGSAGNQLTTTAPTASHTYAKAGAYTVRSSVAPSAACNGAVTPLSTRVTITECSDAPPLPQSKIDICKALLWTSIIMALVGTITLLVGCFLSAFPYTAAAGEIVEWVGIGLVGLAALLFFFWWVFCRFFTPCDVILAVRTTLIVLLVVLPLAALAVDLFSGFKLPCFIKQIVTFAYWGTMMAMVDWLARDRRCLIENPSGTPPASSSTALTGRDFMRARANRVESTNRSSARTAVRGQAPPDQEPAAGAVMNADRPRPAGLGDVVKTVTSAVGITPCEGCHRRAERLNRAFPFGGSGPREQPPV